MSRQQETEKHYLAIGRFVCAFSNLELEMKADIMEALKLTPSDARRVLIHDFAMTCTIMESVFADRAGDEKSAALRKLIRGCRALNDHRVKIVHGFWSIGGEEIEVGYHSRRSLKIERHYKNHEEIAKLADEAELLMSSIGKWMQDWTIWGNARPG